MPRKSKPIEEPDLEMLSDAFKRALEDEPKRRSSTSAVRAENKPEPVKPKRPTADDVQGVGGMVEKRWSGVPMWQCPRCNGTTFNAQEAKVHKCKQVRYADEEGLAD